MQSTLNITNDHGTLNKEKGPNELGAKPLETSIPEVLIKDVNDNVHDVACEGPPGPNFNNLPVPQPPLKIRIRRPPNNVPPSSTTSVADGLPKPFIPSPAQAKPIVQADKPPAKHGRAKKAPTNSAASTCQPAPSKPMAKRGRPKKAPANSPLFTFQPAPLTDANWERIEARGAAWFDAHWATQELTVKGFRKNAQPKPNVMSDLRAGGDVVQSESLEKNKGKKPVSPNEGQLTAHTGVRQSARSLHGGARA
ncbi:hypothetical protein PCASD_01016 [Puccinia coronata f. sp. avenae]|uniref:Uncharacterized protein n=1 Tax=Puccinia coronata f. sp. avenae TaxID=200324 RepID=A0A2N5VMK8_9BASI|nr:hypothetical protein PCASD_01016 [Puccinia coronata f. sp. avenae]